MEGMIGPSAERIENVPAWKILIYNIKTIFTSFGQNTAESYDNQILLTMVCIFWPEFGLKRHYFVLHCTSNGKGFLKHIPPLDRYETSFPLPLYILMCNQQCYYDLIPKGETMFQETFPLDVMQNSMVWTQILAKVYRARLKQCAYH